MKSEPFSLSLDISRYNFSIEAIKSMGDTVLAKSLWPLVYIISDKALMEAYIGESTNVMSRMLNHLTNSERNKLGDLHIITFNKFNKSSTLDIESNLIKYMAGDGTFKLLNGNAGLAFHNYYQKSKYFEIFTQIWSKLKEKGIVRKSLEEIDNSDLFKYSPYKSLTDDQYTSLEKIINAWIHKPVGSIFIFGSAGTGKTILAIFLIKLLKTDLSTLFDTGDMEIGERMMLISELKQKFKDPKVALVVPMTSLRNTLKRVFKNIKGLDADMVIGPSEVAKEKYDILLVDEAHRLRRRTNLTNYKIFDDNNNLLGLGKEGTELQWILKQSKNQVFFYDPAQSIKPTDVKQKDFDKELEKSVEKIQLKSQLRVKGGRDYITYIDKLLRNSFSENELLFNSKNYEFFLFNSLAELITKLKQKEKEVKLCRLVAGYSWAWISRSHNIPDIEIEGIHLNWNSASSEWINSPNAINEVGCIHTTQGYDLNYTGVIFGKEISYDPLKDEIIIIPKNYLDRNGKRGITDLEDLKAYIINIYKTLMYRGIKGTYVYVCDEKLRDYFSKHIPIFGEKYYPKVIPLNNVKPYLNSVPIFDLNAAAGDFGPPQHISEHQWIELPPTHKPKKDYFVCKVVGESMNKRIPNGSWCLFQRSTSGSREGKIVLVEHHKIQDADFGSGYTVKSYHSEKNIDTDNWSHKKIVLKPMSTDPNYKAIILTQDDLTELKVIGVFVDVLINEQSQS